MKPSGPGTLMLRRCHLLFIIMLMKVVSTSMFLQGSWMMAFEAAEEYEEGVMPESGYIYFHPEAQLTDVRTKLG